ncbi:MAG: CoA-binding protein [Caldibacillus debilis]|uniref:CoA-binding protein n=1 Tax=Caldibacillus debilis TaxID=301148 RepID=A0A3E0K3E2_9BACI|nr:CoA-binding protein [Bacillaceae bacterium]OUM83547.1 MAG: CoA-binding protein [Caldibacillus debilis]MBY6271383.1 CoA-binding protein [Bacillaceae bacterium]REJ18156.1 MAG: CoA-binding protein [Caldibacillus debilis]REJ27899.1 MAG: CoA-binding protein [Caldibacillus debilis]
MENPPLEEIAKILRRAKRIAVVGLSDKPDRTSYQIAKEMQNLGYEIIPVNPMIDEALGVKAVSSLKEIEGHVDIVNIFRKSEYLMEIAKEFVEIDADVFWAQQGIADEETYRFLKERGVTVIMDRCIKVMHSLTKNMPLTGE